MDASADGVDVDGHILYNDNNFETGPSVGLEDATID